jgi:hypothetical protein
MSKWITLEESLKGRERAVERERERIIKLLGEIYWVSIAKTDDESRIINTNDLISIIKGETA